MDEPPITCGVMVLRKTFHAWNREFERNGIDRKRD